MDNLERTGEYLKTIEATVAEKMGEEKLQKWRYEEQVWEQNVLTRQNDEFPNPYELAKEKGEFLKLEHWMQD